MDRLISELRQKSKKVGNVGNTVTVAVPLRVCTKRCQEHQEVRHINIAVVVDIRAQRACRCCCDAHLVYEHTSIAGWRVICKCKDMSI